MKRIFLFPLIFMLAGCNDKPDVVPQSNQLAVFPNPAEVEVNIHFANPDNSMYTLVVFDTRGDMLLEKNESLAEPSYRVNVSDEPAGTYHVVLVKNNTTIVRQFTKVK